MTTYARLPGARLSLFDRRAVPVAATVVAPGRNHTVAVMLRTADDRAVDLSFETPDAAAMALLLRHGRGTHELAVGHLAVSVDELPHFPVTGLVVVRTADSTAVVIELAHEPPVILTLSATGAAAFGDRLAQVAAAQPTTRPVLARY